jgi:hypothetical protein
MLHFKYDFHENMGPQQYLQMYFTKRCVQISLSQHRARLCSNCRKLKREETASLMEALGAL